MSVRNTGRGKAKREAKYVSEFGISVGTLFRILSQK